MKTDFEGMQDLLEKDLEMFLDDMKDALVPMLESGLDEKLKTDLTRALHAIKSLIGMFELHESVEFVSGVELIVQKIFELERQDISNDLLNNLFEIKDQIERLVRYFISSNSILLSDALRVRNKSMLDELERDYVEYKLGKENLKNSAEKKVSNIPDESAPELPSENREEDKVKDRKDALFVKHDIMHFTPTFLKQEDVAEFHAMFIKLLPNVKQIEIDLVGTKGLDFTGVQFIQAIKKHCKISGVRLSVVGRSNLVALEAGILGVDL